MMMIFEEAQASARGVPRSYKVVQSQPHFRGPSASQRSHSGLDTRSEQNAYWPSRRRMAPAKVGAIEQQPVELAQEARPAERDDGSWRGA